MTLLRAQYVAGESPLIADESGHPVWPLRDTRDEEQLRSLVALFGGDVAVIQAGVASRSDTGEGAVACFSEASYAAALLYSHLTRRRAVQLDSRGSDWPDDVEVVVGHWADISPEIYDELYCRRSRRAIGIVAGTNNDDLYRAVLLRSAAASLIPCTDLPRVLVLPDGNLTVTDSNATVIGQQSLVASTIVALEEPAALWVSLIHSDGVDASLGNIVMCGVERRREEEDGERPPPCISNRFCHRLKAPIESALCDQRIFSPARIRARVVVYGACWGTIPQPALVDATWTIADCLMQSPGVGAILTTWQEAFLQPGDLQSVLDSLTGGHAAGQALSVHNAALTDLQPGNQLCLLGDPRVLASRAVRPVRVASGYNMPTGRSDLSDTSFLRGVVLSISRVPAHVRRNLSRRLAACEATTAAVDQTLWTRELSDDVLASLLECKDRKLSRISLRFFSGVKGSDNFERCFVCGKPARVVTVKFGEANLFRRELIVCITCGINQDRPYNTTSPMTVSYDGDRTLSLSRTPAKVSSAGIIVDLRRADVLRAIWPRSTCGDLSDRFTLPRAVNRSLFVVTIPFLEAGRLSVMRFQGRSERTIQ